MFGSIYGDMQGDPIFGAHTRNMRNMNNLMNSFFGEASPFGGMGMPMGPGMGGMNPIMNMNMPPMQAMMPMNNMIMPFGGGRMDPFGGGIPDMNMMMSNFGNSPHAMSSSSMQVMSMSAGHDGRPVVYQASSSTRQAPGGFKETRKTVTDSRSGVKKMSIGRYMGDRAHIKEREENINTGQREDKEDFINIDDTAGHEFDNEWRQTAYGNGNGRPGTASNNLALTYGDTSHQQQQQHHHNHKERRPKKHATSSYSAPRAPSPSVVIEELPPSDNEEEQQQQQQKINKSKPSSSSNNSRPIPKRSPQHVKKVTFKGKNPKKLEKMRILVR